MHSKESTTLSIKCDGIGGIFLLHHGLAFQCSTMIEAGTGMCAIILFVCLFGFNVAFKHLRSYREGACLKQWHFDKCAPTQECQADDTGHDTQHVTVYRHRADRSLCYPLMWNVTLEYTATHFNVCG